MPARLSFSDYKEFAEGRNLIWMGEKLPKGVREKTFWKCKTCDHLWESCHSFVKQNKFGCPVCGHRHGGTIIRKTLYDYISLGKEKGYIYIGTSSPEGNKQKVLWFCRRCHRSFLMRYNDIYNNHGCRYCWKMENGQKTSAPQLKLAKMLGGIVNFRIGKLSIDVALPERMIAVEYDCWYWHAHKHEYDIERTKKLAGLGWKVFRIKTNRIMPSQEAIMGCLKELDDADYVEIVTADWGKAKPFRSIN